MYRRPQSEDVIHDAPKQTWGRHANHYYDEVRSKKINQDDADDDGDYDDERLEAEKIKLLRLSQLRRSQNVFAHDFYGAPPESPHKPQKNADSIALEVLLDSLSRQEPKKSKLDRDTVKLSLGFCASYSELTEVIMHGGCKDYFALESLCRFTVCPKLDRSSLRQLFFPELQDRVKSLFSFELRLFVWFNCLFEALHLIRYSRSLGKETKEGCVTAMKIFKKITKVRNRIGEEDLKSVQRELASCRAKLDTYIVKQREKDGTRESGTKDNIEPAVLPSPTSKPPVAHNLSVVEQAILVIDRMDRNSESRQKHLQQVVQRIAETGNLQFLHPIDVSKEIQEVVREIANEGVREIANEGVCEARTPPETAKEIVESSPEEIPRLSREMEFLRAVEHEKGEKEKVLSKLPPLPQEVEGSRKISKSIEKNRGLTRKRKAFSGHARVHNREKYAKKMKKMATSRLKGSETSGTGDYGGELAGITMHVNRSRKLTGEDERRRSDGETAEHSGDERSRLRKTSSGNVKTFVPPPLNYHGRQIEELVLKVVKIETECLGDKENVESKVDEFVARKKEIYACIFLTKNMIRERCAIQTRAGNTVEAIEKGSLINKNIELLSQQFIGLKEVFKKQSKNPKADNLNPAELDTRFKELQIIKQQIEECRDLVKRGTEYSDGQMKNLTDFLKQMEAAGVAPPQQFDAGGGGWREPTAEEQAILSRWAARDKDFDKQIWNVGEAVDRLNVIAVDISEKADRQGKMALELSRQADEAHQEVVEVNNRLKKLMLAGGGMNFCCKLFLTVVLIGLIGFIVDNTLNRVKKSTGLARRAMQGEDHEKPNGDPARQVRWNQPRSRQRIFVNGTLRTLDSELLAQLTADANEFDQNQSLGPWERASLVGGNINRNSWSRFEKARTL